MGNTGETEDEDEKQHLQNLNKQLSGLDNTLDFHSKSRNDLNGTGKERDDGKRFRSVLMQKEE